MIWLGRLLLIIVTSLLQISFWPTLFGYWPAPNFVLAGTVIAGLDRHPSLSLLWALLGGLILDSTLPGRGFYTLTLTLLALVLQWLATRWLSGATPIHLFLVILVVACLMPTLEMFVAGQPWSWLWLQASVVNLIAMGSFYGFTQWRRPLQSVS